MKKGFYSCVLSHLFTLCHCLSDLISVMKTAVLCVLAGGVGARGEPQRDGDRDNKELVLLGKTFNLYLINQQQTTYKIDTKGGLLADKRDHFFSTVCFSARVRDAQS